MWLTVMGNQKLCWAGEDLTVSAREVRSEVVGGNAAVNKQVVSFRIVVRFVAC